MVGFDVAKLAQLSLMIQDKTFQLPKKGLKTVQLGIEAYWATKQNSRKALKTLRELMYHDLLNRALTS
ncbi:MAG: hypothetical protein U0Y10_12940 [Spirosomataceae bacterium]